MSKLISRLICAVLLAALLLALPVAAAPAEPQPYYPTGGVPEYTVTEVPATGDAPLTLQDDRTLEEIIVEGLRNIDEKITIPSGKIMVAEVKTVYFAIVKAYPEFFYVGNTVSYTYSNNYVTSIFPQYDEELAKEEVITAFHDRVEEILSETTAPGMSQVEMALSLHDYLVLHCAYDWNVANGNPASSNNVYTAYGALMEGNAVCQGYAMAYNLLLNKVGIETDYVTSVIPERGSHGWSLVEIGEKWYHVDVTWDDPTWNFSGSKHDLPGFCRHDYFLVSTETMEKDHGDFTVSQTTDDTYESGYVFSGADVPFFSINETFYYIGRDKALQSTDDLQNGPAVNNSTVLAQRFGSTLFLRDYFGNYTYCYDMISKQRYTLTGVPSGSGYGLQEYDDGVYLVEIPGSAGVTRVQKLQLPLDGLLHCNDPVQAAGITVSIRNGLSQDRTVSLCLAAYDEGGRLVSLSWEDVSVASGKSAEAAFALPADAAETRVFYLDEARRPLRAAAVLP